MPKEEASSSVIATKSLLLSRVIDTKENCDVITLDILTTFVQCVMLESVNSEQTTLKICRALVGILCKIVKEVHKDFVTYDHNADKILSDNVLKLLCRMLKTSILCY